MINDRLRQGANLVFAAGQVLLPVALFSGGFDATAAQPGLVDAANPATPAGYAFAIWGVIYLGAGAYAVLQALPGRAGDPLFRRIGWLTALGYALCCAWLWFARFGPVWPTVPLIAAMLLSLGAAFVLAVRGLDVKGRIERFMVITPLAIYTGWLSAATFVNAADVLPGYGFDRFGLSASELGVMVVVAGGLTATIFTLFSRAKLAYVAAVLWALVSIVVANGARLGETLVADAAFAVAVALVLLTLLIVATRRHLSRRSVRA